MDIHGFHKEDSINERFGAIEKRSRIRRFRPDDVPEPVFMKVLTRQGWHLQVVRERLAAASPCRFPGPNSEIHMASNDKVVQARMIMILGYPDVSPDA